METFSNNRVTKNNSIAKLRQFSLWARQDTNRVVSRANYFWKTGEHPKSEAHNYGNKIFKMRVRNQEFF